MNASCAGYSRVQLELGDECSGATRPAALGRLTLPAARIAAATLQSAPLPPARLSCGSGVRCEARIRTGALVHVAEEAYCTSSAAGTASARKSTTILRAERDGAPLSAAAIGACLCVHAAILCAAAVRTSSGAPSSSRKIRASSLCSCIAAARA
eukprot:scaffold40207_cov43-Phaeocystis_antarctica.AAC.1